MPSSNESIASSKMIESSEEINIKSTTTTPKALPSKSTTTTTQTASSSSKSSDKKSPKSSKSSKSPYKKEQLARRAHLSFLELSLAAGALVATYAICLPEDVQKNILARLLGSDAVSAIEGLTGTMPSSSKVDIVATNATTASSSSESSEDVTVDIESLNKTSTESDSPKDDEEETFDFEPTGDPELDALQRMLAQNSARAAKARKRIATLSDPNYDSSKDNEFNFESLLSEIESVRKIGKDHDNEDDENVAHDDASKNVDVNDNGFDKFEKMMEGLDGKDSNDSNTINSTTSDASLSLHQCYNGNKNVTEEFLNNFQNATNETTLAINTAFHKANASKSTNSTTVSEGNGSNCSENLMLYRGIQFDTAEIFNQLVLPLEQKNSTADSDLSSALEDILMKATNTTKQEMKLSSEDAEDNDDEDKYNVSKMVKMADQRAQVRNDTNSTSDGSNGSIPLFKLRSLHTTIHDGLENLFSNCFFQSTGKCDFASSVGDSVRVEKVENSTESDGKTEMVYTLALNTSESGSESDSNSNTIRFFKNNNRRVELETGNGFKMVLERKDSRFPVTSISVEGKGQIGEM